MRFEDLTGRRVVIWGAGREGHAAAEALAARGLTAPIVVTGDPAPQGALGGDAALAALAEADVVVASPGIPHTSPEWQALRARGAALTSLTDLWLTANRERVIGVTGTKGKSTTAALTRHILASCGVSASLVGNLGTPVTHEDPPGAHVAVEEISSYQAASLTCSPAIAVLTSLYPEHIPWHGSFEQYVADKLRICAFGPRAVVVPDRAGTVWEWLSRLQPEAAARATTPADLGLEAMIPDDDAPRSAFAGLRWAHVGELPQERIPVRGHHNWVNATLALAAVDATGLVPDRAAALAAVASFHALPHRLEVIPAADPRLWVDDSLATNPQAVAASLEAFAHQSVALVAGGSERNLPFAPLGEYLRGRRAPVHAVLLGPAGERMLREIGDAFASARHFDHLADAVGALRADPALTDVVLLSPGAPSFDEFGSYEERSAAFRAAARA